MKIDLSRLLQNPSEHIDIEIVEPFETLSQMVFDDKVDTDTVAEIVGDVRFLGAFRHLGRQSVVQLKGTVSGTVRDHCCRCLKTTDVDIETPICVHFSHDAMEDNWREYNDEDIVPDYPIIGTSVDLSEVIRDAILLAVPMQVYCQVDCKGCCSICGQDLNQKMCDCEAPNEKPSSPFDVLSELL